MKERVIYLIIIIWLMSPKLTLSSSNNNSSKNLSVNDWLHTISKLERILNKKQPTYSDYKYYYPSDSSAGQGEYGLQMQYCKNTLKIEPDSQKCKEFMVNIDKNPNNSPSFMLIDSKERITQNSSKRIEIFINPNLNICTKEDLINIDSGKSISGILLVDNNKVKKIGFVVPCNEDSMIVSGRLQHISIDGTQFGK
jgi:hypothetical protein